MVGSNSSIGRGSEHSGGRSKKHNIATSICFTSFILTRSNANGRSTSSLRRWVTGPISESVCEMGESSMRPSPTSGFPTESTETCGVAASSWPSMRVVLRVATMTETAAAGVPQSKSSNIVPGAERPTDLLELGVSSLAVFQDDRAPQGLPRGAYCLKDRCVEPITVYRSRFRSRPYRRTGSGSESSRTD